jgi:hypothetical protein
MNSEVFQTTWDDQGGSFISTLYIISRQVREERKGLNDNAF